MRSLVSHLMIYATGRELSPVDRAEIQHLVTDLGAERARGNEPTLTRVLLGIVKSDAFLERRGELSGK